MNNARSVHTASVLPNGKVLITGGYDGSLYLNSSELYDPSTGLWTATSSMNSARSEHTTSILTNGDVLATGGFINIFLSTSELY
ncbi:unnamed protein product [Rotaria sp. Silwood1]|nr:unnamed protein product [Rotaria sp. Silwood1]